MHLAVVHCGDVVTDYIQSGKIEKSVHSKFTVSHFIQSTVMSIINAVRTKLIHFSVLLIKLQLFY